MSNPKALLGEIRRLAGAVGKVRAADGKTALALDMLDAALTDFLDSVSDAERLIGEVGDLTGELHGGEAWRPVWHQPEARKAADFRYTVLSALRLGHDADDDAALAEVHRLWGAASQAEVPAWIPGEPPRYEEGAVWWVMAPGLRAPVRAHWYHEWLIPGTPCCVDAPITAHAAYTTGKLPPPLPAKVKP